jgi:hypothetical protein
MTGESLSEARRVTRGQIGETRDHGRQSRIVRRWEISRIKMTLVDLDGGKLDPREYRATSRTWEYEGK